MPKKEYIDVELLKKSAKKYGITLPSIMMNAVPNADVRENVRGKWIRLPEDDYCQYECSECGHRRASIADCDFCPKCAADMRGEENA